MPEEVPALEGAPAEDDAADSGAAAAMEHRAMPEGPAVEVVPARDGGGGFATVGTPQGAARLVANQRALQESSVTR